MRDTYPSAPTLEAPAPQGFNRLLRPVAAAISIPLAAIGIASCSTDAKPLPPRDRFIEVAPNHSSLIDPSNPLAGIHPFEEPPGGWSSQERADAYHLHELVKNNPCKPEAGTNIFQEQRVKIGDLAVSLQQKTAAPECLNGYYTRIETEVDGVANTEAYTGEQRVIPADSAKSPYLVGQESIPDRPDLQAYTVMMALQEGDQVISCVVNKSLQQEVCFANTVGKPAGQ